MTVSVQPLKFARPLTDAIVVPPVHVNWPTCLLIVSLMGWVGNATPPVAPPPGCWLKLRVPAANTDASGTSDAMSAAARLTANNLRRDKLRPGWVIRLSSNPRRGPRAKFRLFFGHDSTCRLSRSYVEFGVS